VTPSSALRTLGWFAWRQLVGLRALMVMTGAMVLVGATTVSRIGRAVPASDLFILLGIAAFSFGVFVPLLNASSASDLAHRALPFHRRDVVRFGAMLYMALGC